MRRAGFLLILILTLPWAAVAQPSTPEASQFYQEANRLVDRATRKRDGVVLWLDRSDGTQRVFGNAALLDQTFLPGSILKLVTAEAALASGREWRHRCAGRERIGGRLRHCWIRKGHGELDLATALGQSCNLFFSWLGTQLGYPTLREALAKEGFATASALPASDDRVATAADLAIGDYFDFAVTPDEVARFWNRYLDKLSDPGFAAIRQGLRRAVREGTAKRVGTLELEILGKTGTGDARRSAYKTNGWFLAAYPVERPRWALVVFLKEAHGFEEAAALAEQIFRTAELTGVLR